jgi:hypothetical protein
MDAWASSTLSWDGMFISKAAVRKALPGGHNDGQGAADQEVVDHREPGTVKVVDPAEINDQCRVARSVKAACTWVGQ